MTFHAGVLTIDARAEASQIVSWIAESVREPLGRKGAVVGMSGGLDSAVVLALCVQALGTEKVLPLIMPERESDPLSETLAKRLCRELKVEPTVMDITAALEGLDCYQLRDDAIRRTFPEYDPSKGYTAKITLPSTLLEDGAIGVYSLTVVRPSGEVVSCRLRSQELLQIVAATNCKQRMRMTVLYNHAESRQFAVVGTANKDEHVQGFYVKYGDGGTDLQPILHLYKTQVRQLATHLRIPKEILYRTPATDTYSAGGTQQEFFFRLPFELMDLLWYAMEHNVQIGTVAQVLGLQEREVIAAFEEFVRRRHNAKYLHCEHLSLIPASEEI
jgi:NAD+ synthase